MGAYGLLMLPAVSCSSAPAPLPLIPAPLLSAPLLSAPLLSAHPSTVPPASCFLDSDPCSRSSAMSSAPLCVVLSSLPTVSLPLPTVPLMFFAIGLSSLLSVFFVLVSLAPAPSFPLSVLFPSVLLFFLPVSLPSVPSVPVRPSVLCLPCFLFLSLVLC
jgi:hypothetical protein